MNERSQNEKVDIKQEQLADSFKKILVAVDYQAQTEEVFAKAIQLAQTSNSNLMIFHCMKEEIAGVPEMVALTSMGPYGGVYTEETIELKEKLLKEATEEVKGWLNGFCQRAMEKGIPTEFDHKIGDPGKQICSLAKMWEADLIVIGRRGRTGISEMFLGSVSNYVVHHAECSVLIVQH